MSERSSEEIQHAIEGTRAEMDRTIDAIRERVSPAELVDQILRQLRDGGGQSLARGAGEFANGLGRTIRDNPVPSLLIGTGLAWLAVASMRRRHDDHDPELEAEEALAAHYGAADAAAARHAEHLRRQEAGVGHEDDPAWSDHYAAAATGAGAGPADAAEAERDRLRTMTTVDAVRASDPHAPFGRSTVGAAAVSPPNPPDDDQEPASTGERAWRSASDVRERAERVAGAAREQAEDAVHAAREGAGQASRGLHERAADWSDEAREGAEHVGEAARHGVDEGRRRMRHAGEEARAGARRAGSRARQRGREAGRGFARWFDEQPLVVGTLGLALGAALGALLPPTRREDRWFGDTRDDLAERAREETRRARRAAERGAAAARTEAERQNLTPEGMREELRDTQRAAEQKVHETRREMEATLRRTAEQKLEEAEAAARAKVEQTGERLRRVGDSAEEAARDEAERQNLGGELRGSRSPE